MSNLVVDLLLLRSALAPLHALGFEVYQANAIFKTYGFSPNYLKFLRIFVRRIISCFRLENTFEYSCTAGDVYVYIQQVASHHFERSCRGPSIPFHLVKFHSRIRRKINWFYDTLKITFWGNFLTTKRHKFYIFNTNCNIGRRKKL